MLDGCSQLSPRLFLLPYHDIYIYMNTVCIHVRLRALFSAQHEQMGFLFYFIFSCHLNLKKKSIITAPQSDRCLCLQLLFSEFRVFFPHSATMKSVTSSWSYYPSSSLQAVATPPVISPSANRDRCSLPAPFLPSDIKSVSRASGASERLSRLFGC